MKAIRLVLLVVLGIFILYVKLKTGGTATSAPAAAVAPADAATASAPAMAPAAAVAPVPPAADSPAEADGGIPQKALTVLQYVRQNGQAPEGYVGGRVFDNREGRLPDGGDYREFDVDPHNGQRNAERIIVEWGTKKAWYTGDHYQTFTPMP